MIRIAVAGLGGYGSVLVRHIAKASEKVDCKIVAGVKSRRAQFAKVAENLAAQSGELFTDTMTMFEKMQGKAEVVFITTSINSHLDYALAAVKYGYHMHLEKPAAATVQEIDIIDQAVKDAGRICLVGFQSIHGSDINSLKDLVVSGKLGKIKKLTCWSGSPRTKEYYTRNNWAGRLRLNDQWVLDSPSMNALAHQINNMLYIASPEPGRYAIPTAVRAELYVAGAVDSHDTAAIEIQTDVGQNCYFIASHCPEEETGVTLKVEGEDGVGIYGTFDRGIKIIHKDGTEETRPSDRENSQKMVINLIEAIGKNDPSLIRCKLQDARLTTLALNGAHESSLKVHRIDPKYLRVVDEGTKDERTMVEGLNELLRTSAEKGCLFSDLDPAPPWAVAAKRYDLAGYKSFPQQFTWQ